MVARAAVTPAWRKLQWGWGGRTEPEASPAVVCEAFMGCRVSKQRRRERERETVSKYATMKLLKIKKQKK